MYIQDGTIKTVSEKYFWTFCSFHVRYSMMMYVPPMELKIPCCSANFWYKELVHGSKRAPCMYIHDGIIETVSKKIFMNFMQRPRKLFLCTLLQVS